MYYGYMDPTYILVLIGVVLSMWASSRVSGTYSRYSRVRSASGLTGADTARELLRRNGAGDVTVRHVSGQLTDHYDPRTRTVNLSDAVYDSTSVAAIGVAAHECGHVMQDVEGYFPLRLRTALVPAANIGARLCWPLIILGVILGNMGVPFIQIGILMFILSVAFQVVTLPVEYNASSRALRLLEEDGILGTSEVGDARNVLSAAALTYVAAAAASVLQLLRLFILFGGRRRD